jgi:hypothetical protein
MPPVALTVRVAEELPPLVKVDGVGNEHVIPVAALQVRFTVPVNPFTEARLITVVPLLPALTGTLDDAGIMVKSESGFDVAVLRIAEDGL